MPTENLTAAGDGYVAASGSLYVKLCDSLKAKIY